MITEGTKMSVSNLCATDLHIHRGLQCIFVLKGSVVIEVEDTRVEMEAEDLLVINSNQLHSVVEDHSNISLVLEIEKDYINSECGICAKSVIKCHCIGYSDESSNYYGLKKAMTKMLFIGLKKASGYQLDYKVEVLRFLHILYTGFVEDGTSSQTLPPNERKTINSLIGYLNENYHRPIKLEELAKKEYMSPQYFSKYFKRKTGYGFLQYLTELRLKKAVFMLINTEDSISKIALDNGFSDAKALNGAFKKAYKETPGSFRKRYRERKETEPREADRSGVNLEVNVEIKEFQRYLQKYDINFEQGDAKRKEYEIVLGGKTIRSLRPQENILNIGKVETAGYTNLFGQIEKLRDDLGFKYVYFQLDHRFVTNDIQYSLVIYNQFFRTVDQLEKLHMVPFLKMKPEPEFLSRAMEEAQEDIRQKADIFMNCISKVYSRQYVETWKINICFDTDMDEKKAEIYYETWYRVVKKKYPKMQIGIYALQDSDKKSISRFKRFIQMVKDRKCIPDFASFGAFAMNRTESYMANQFFYSGLRQYYREILNAVKGVFEESEIKVPDLFMTEWNSLMGNLEDESILYFRSAILVELLLELNDEIKGAGYWADSGVSAMYSGEAPMTSLALHMMDDVRRPIHPVLEMLKRIGTEIMYEDKNILISRTSNDEFTVLVWNPQYLNPFYSLDNVTTDSLCRKINIKLKNMEKGQYRIKRIVCNKDNSGVVTLIANAGFPDFTDKDVFKYVQNNIAYGLNVYDEYIGKGSYVLNTTLLYNSVVMYVVRRVGI